MPSNRQFRVILTVTVVVILAFLFFHSSEKSSDRAFYGKTVDALDAKLRAQSGDTAGNAAHHIPPPAPEKKSSDNSDDHAKASPDTDSEDAKRKPPEVALGSGGDQQKVVKDGKGYATGEKGGDELGKTGKKEDDDKTDAEREIEAELNSILKRSPIIIFSKSYCPHSKKAKHIFGLYSVTPAPFIVELDENPLGSRLQDELNRLTGRRTVPNIMINGHSIGGGDDVSRFHENGELVGKIKELGGKRIMEARLKGIKEK